MTGAKGRPLRFLAAVLGGWIAMRAWMLWPVTMPPPAMRETHAVATSAATPALALVFETAPTVGRSRGAAWRAHFLPPRPDAPAMAMAMAMRARPRSPRPAPSPAPSPSLSHGATAGERRPARTTADPYYQLALAGLVRYGVAPPEPAPGGWRVSLWVVARGGGGATLATPQLGGSQMGVRVARPIAGNGRIAAVTRLAFAPETGTTEAAAGIEWRPGGGAVALVAEQRIALARSRGGSALGIVGGVADRPLPAGFRLDGYGQAGVIVREDGSGDVDGYADGALHVIQPVARAGDATLHMGIGAWGAAQRGAARLDVGPAAAIVLPVARRPVRLALEWRQRVAGNARPASGPALSLGTDF